MSRKKWIYLLLICINVCFFSIHAQAVEKTPEYEFKLSKDKVYQKAKDPSNYEVVDLEYLVEMQNRCPQYVSEQGRIDNTMVTVGLLEGKIKADSITIDGITSTLEPWNEKDIIGQIEAFSEVYITDFGVDSRTDYYDNYYRTKNITREDLHRYALWRPSDPNLYFEETIYFEAKNVFMGGEWEINAQGKEVYFNFDDEKVRYKISNYSSEALYSDPYSKFAKEFLREKDYICPKLEMNNQVIEYMGIVDIQNLPENLVYVYDSKWSITGVIKGLHSDGTICEALKIVPETVYRDIPNPVWVCQFYIYLSKCENCTSHFKVAGVDVGENSYQDVAEKLKIYNLNLEEDYNYNIIRKIEYKRGILSYFYDYAYAKDKDNIVAEFDKLEFNYTTVE